MTGSVPLPLRGRRLTPWIPREPCQHKFGPFMPLEDFLKAKGQKIRKLAHPCTVRECAACGEVSGVMWSDAA